MSDYRPIACVDHERLEFAALSRHWLELVVTEGAHRGPQRLRARDVYTRDGAEWLAADTVDGRRLVVRLDHLRLPPRSR